MARLFIGSGTSIAEREIMKTKIMAVLTAVMASFGWHALAQTYDTNNEVVQTFAGSGFAGYVDGVGQLTMFNNPNVIVADSHSNLFVWDSGNYRIRKIAPDGTLQLLLAVAVMLKELEPMLILRRMASAL